MCRCRYPKMVRASLRCIRRMVATALAHTGSLADYRNRQSRSRQFHLLMGSMAALYENDPGSQSTPRRGISTFDFGKCWWAFHHGTGSRWKPPVDHGRLTYPTSGAGTQSLLVDGSHSHGQIQNRFDTRDFSGCRVESFAFSPRWTPGREQRISISARHEGVILHKDFGRGCQAHRHPAIWRRQVSDPPHIEWIDAYPTLPLSGLRWKRCAIRPAPISGGWVISESESMSRLNPVSGGDQGRCDVCILAAALQRLQS